MSVNIKTFTWHRENGWNLTHNSSHPIQASCTHEALINESTTYTTQYHPPSPVLECLSFWSTNRNNDNISKNFFGFHVHLRKRFIVCYSYSKKKSCYTYTDWKICYSTEIWKLYLNAHKKTFHVKEQNQFNTVVELALRPISTDIHWCSNITP